MTNYARSSTLMKSHLRHQKNNLFGNPDALPRDENILINVVPEQLALLLNGKPKEKIHAACTIEKLTKRRELRKALILQVDFIETVSFVLMDPEEDELEENSTQWMALKRAQQLCLRILQNLFLESNVTDKFICNEDLCLKGIAKMLVSHDVQTQELVSLVFDYACVEEDNRTLISQTDQMLFGVVQLLHNTKSVEAREHILQGLLRLTEDSLNQFLIPRQDGMLDAIMMCLFYTQISIPYKALATLKNFAHVKENIVLIATNRQLRQRLQICVKVSKQKLQEEKATLPTSDVKHHSKIVSIGTILLQLLFKYDTRLNSDVILNGTDFNSVDKIVIPTKDSTFESVSIAATSRFHDSFDQSLHTSKLEIEQSIHHRRIQVRKEALKQKRALEASLT